MNIRARVQKEKKKPAARDIIFPLAIGALGTIIAVAAFFTVPGFLMSDVILLMVVVIGAVIGYNRRTVRGLVTIPFLYAATGVAAITYDPASPYIGAPFGDFREVEPTREVKALSFFVLMLVIWIALEAISWALFKDMSLPKLGLLDNFGGVLVHILVGVVVAALLFNALGYAQRWPGDTVNAKLAPVFLPVIRIWYQTQSFWFESTPGFYTGALTLTENSGE